MHVLFVDDFFETRDLFRLGFSLQGHTMETAHNGMEALRIMAQSAGNLDLVIIDYHMPEMDGLELVRQMRRRKDIASAPVILLTGSSKGLLEDEALTLGVARVVYKPTLPADLVIIAQEVVAFAKPARR